MAPPLYCSQSKQPRPDAARVLYVDGPPDVKYRPGADVVLSHWLRHAAPAPLAAATGTAMALRWVATQPAPVDLVVNTHVDVDGILAAWVVQHGSSAEGHADT